MIAYHDGGHRLLRGGSLAYDNDRVVFVGGAYTGPSDHQIDATGKLVIPGLVNLHCHATTEASGRLIADAGRRDFFHTGFLNYQTAPPGVTPLNARENLDIGNRFALVELLGNGCTTIVELGAVNEATVAFAGRIGIRAYLTPGYRSASYRLGPEGQLGYEWDEEAGVRGLERAKAFIRAHQGAHDGRIRGMLYPLQVDTCSPELFRATRKAADELGVGISTHVGQNLVEFHEMLRRHGKTPVEVLDDAGLLGPDTIVFNAATLAGARALRRDDIGRLAPGAKADIVILDMRTLRIGPYRDPIKALVNCGTGDDVETVIVDGRTVVESGRVVAIDEEALRREAQQEAERLWTTLPEWHWQRLTTEQFSPTSFPALKRDLQ